MISQALCHAVKATCELAEFIRRAHFQPRVKVAALDLAHGRVKLPDWLEELSAYEH